MIDGFETLTEDGSVPIGMGIAQLLCIIIVIIVSNDEILCSIKFKLFVFAGACGACLDCL